MPVVSRVAIGSLRPRRRLRRRLRHPGRHRPARLHPRRRPRRGSRGRARAGASPGYAVYNLGTGVPVSVLELIALFERAVGHELPQADPQPRRPGDVAATYCDPSQGAARARTGRPALTIDDACARLLELADARTRRGTRPPEFRRCAARARAAAAAARASMSCAGTRRSAGTSGTRDPLGEDRRADEQQREQSRTRRSSS